MPNRSAAEAFGAELRLLTGLRTAELGLPDQALALGESRFMVRRILSAIHALVLPAEGLRLALLAIQRR